MMSDYGYRDTAELVRWLGGTLIEIMITAVSKLRSLCDKAISRLSQPSARSVYVTANTLTATHILDYNPNTAAVTSYTFFFFWSKQYSYGGSRSSTYVRLRTDSSELHTPTHRAAKSRCQIDWPFKRIEAFTRFGLLQSSANRVLLY